MSPAYLWIKQELNITSPWSSYLSIRLCFFSTNFSKYQLEPGSALAGPSGPSAVAVLEQVQPSTRGEPAREEKGSEEAGGEGKTRSLQSVGKSKPEYVYISQSVSTGSQLVINKKGSKGNPIISLIN